MYKWLETFKSHRPEDIAAWLQNGVEREIIGLLRWAISEFGNYPLTLAGGLFANVALNGHIAAEIQPPDLFVFPNMGDGGLAAGAAYLSGAERYNWQPRAIDTMMLGPLIQTDTHNIQQFVQHKPLSAITSQTDEHIARAVQALINEKIIARATGHLEYGPRALGNRSILANPRNPEIHTTLNTRLNRSEFMPFAPIMRAETASRWLIAPESAWTAMKWMTITVQASPELKARCPAVVHVDNTLRPQLIHQTENPILWRLLENGSYRSSRINQYILQSTRRQCPTAHDALNAFGIQIGRIVAK